MVFVVIADTTVSQRVDRGRDITKIVTEHKDEIEILEVKLPISRE